MQPELWPSLQGQLARGILSGGRIAAIDLLESCEVTWTIPNRSFQMFRRVTALGIASVMVAAAFLLLLTGCDKHSSGLPPTSSKAHVSEATWLQYRNDLIETAALVAQYVQHWEKSGTWPKPGTYDTNVLIYKGTESGNPTFPNRRRDFYRTLFDGGRELDVILYDDGRIDVDVLWDREPVAPGR